MSVKSCATLQNIHLLTRATMTCLWFWMPLIITSPQPLTLHVCKAESILNKTKKLWLILVLISALLWVYSKQDPINYVAVDADVHQFKGSSSR